MVLRKALDNLADFFGSRGFYCALSGGRRAQAIERLSRAKVYAKPVWERPAYRKEGSEKTRKKPLAAKAGSQPAHDPPHKELIAAMRACVIAPPEVKTPELMAGYRKLKNKAKALRKALHG